MNVFKRISSWRKESKQHTVSEDFGGDVEVKTTRGTILLPGTFEYDRFSKVYDTEHPEFWLTSALHDWCCVQLAKCGVVLDLHGRIIIYHQWQADEEFLLEMLKASRLVLLRLRLDKEDSAKQTKIVRKLVKRALRYHSGVRKWDWVAKRFGIR